MSTATSAQSLSLTNIIMKLWICNQQYCEMWCGLPHFMFLKENTFKTVVPRVNSSLSNFNWKWVSKKSPLKKGIVTGCFMEQALLCKYVCSEKRSVNYKRPTLTKEVASICSTFPWKNLFVKYVNGNILQNLTLYICEYFVNIVLILCVIIYNY